MCWRKENKVLSFRQHYFCTFVTYNKIQMDINQNYREAVKSIKEAILRSQYRAAASVNKEQLSLYYGIGRYVSENSRTGFWGKGAIEQISSLLQKELPGLRGFSASNIKNMRIFYEAWESAFNRQPMADEFNRVDFLPIGFRPAYKNNL
jgi:hypothetical protein